MVHLILGRPDNNISITVQKSVECDGKIVNRHRELLRTREVAIMAHLTAQKNKVKLKYI